MKLKLSPEQFSKKELARLKGIREDQLKETDLNKHLFQYKKYKVQLGKDLIKARKSLQEEEEGHIQFYLCTDYAYLDKPKMPLFVVGNAPNSWKAFLKERIKEHKGTDATGFFRFDDSKKEETGISYLELTIERGKAKRKIIKKQVDKWLMPTGLEIKFAEVEGVSEEEAPEVVQDKNPIVALDPKDKLQAYFIALQQGKYEGSNADKVRLQVRGNIDKWLVKYDLLTPEQQKKYADKFKQYNHILEQLDGMNEGNIGIEETQVGIRGIVVEGKNDEHNLMSIDVKEIPELRTLEDTRNTHYVKIYKAIDAFNSEKDIQRKRQLFLALMGMIKNWVTYHQKDKVSTQQTRQQLKGLVALYNKHRTFLEDTEAPLTESAVVSTTVDAPIKDIHQDTSSKLGTKTLYSGTAGTQKSTERAQEVMNATVQDRALRLANLLKVGKASNDDSTFGAVMKWLADNPDKALWKEYQKATQQLFQQTTDLRGDIVGVFKLKTLRTRYLLDRLDGKESPYAKLAFALGLMSTKGGSTIEKEDAMAVVENELSSSQIKQLWTAKDSTTFEGAIGAFLGGKHSKIKEQMETYTRLLDARANKKPEELKKATQDYLTSMTKRLRKVGMVGRQIDKEAFYSNFQRWYETANDEERKIALDKEGAFMKMLEEFKRTSSSSSLDKGDLAFIKAKLEAPQNPPQGRETNVIFDQLKALADKQAKKSPLYRWMQNKTIGEEFKNLLFGGELDDPQRAVVAKYGQEGDLKDWEALEKQISEHQGDTTELEKERAEIFNRAFVSVQKLMDQAKVHSDYQKQIVETIKSNGAKGEVYQKLVKLAKSKYTYDFGGDVLALIAKLDPEGKEIAAIRGDQDLLKILQARTLDGKGLGDYKKEWQSVVKQLKLEGELASTELSKTKTSEQGSRDNFKRKHRVNRSKLQSKKEQEQQEKELEQQKGKPEYWAGRLSAEYNHGTFIRDHHAILELFFEAQRSGVKINDILEELDKIDSPFIQYLRKGNKNKNFACMLVIDSASGNQPITARDMLRESGTSSWLKRKTDVGEITNMIDLLTPEEVLKELFDWKTLKQNIEQKRLLVDQLKDSKQSKEEREERQKKLEVVERALENVSLAPSVLKDLDEYLPPQKALEVKLALSDKLGNALTDKGDNKTKQLLLDMKVLSEGDIGLLGTSIKATANLEKVKQSETGIQWSKYSSRMQQRDLETSKYLLKNWDRNERLQGMKGVVDQQELEQEKQELIEALNNSEADLEDALQRFEERKSQYDERMKRVINALTQAIVFTLSMASGVGAAAGIIQLVWAMASGFMQTTISQVLDMATAGDRSGGAKEKAEDFFFTMLADQAGVATGMVGANLAFALDVKAIGTFSQAKKGDGKMALNAWENIIFSPLLKTATGTINNVFSDIGTNFVKNLTDEKDMGFSDPIGNFKAWGEGIITGLPKAYLKSLLLTSTATGVSELADALEWNKNLFKYHDPGQVGSNRYTADGDRPFEASDAKLRFFNNDNDNFSDWFGSWGMFEASPSFGGVKWEDQWNDSNDQSITNPNQGMKRLFENAIDNLSDPKVLMALGNSVVWGSMDGSEHGIKQQLGGLVDKCFESAKIYQGIELDTKDMEALKEDMLKGFEAQIDARTKEIQEALKGGYAQNIDIDEEKLNKGEIPPHEILNIWERMDWIGDKKNAGRNTNFFDTVAKVLNISEGDMRLLRRDSECKAFTTILEFRSYYEENRSAYTRVFANKPFVEHYLKERTHNGHHPKRIAYELDIDGDVHNVTKEIEKEMRDVNGIYAQWEELGDLGIEKRTLVFE